MRDENRKGFAIGLMGGIGSGKSFVLEVMEKEYGFKIIKTDDVSRNQMQPGEAVFNSVVEAFGEGILDEEGFIDRKKLAGIIYADDAKRELLDELTHPPVIEEVDRQIRELKEGEVLVAESALIVDCNIIDHFDSIWLVEAPLEDRLSRLTGKRKITREHALSIMENQLSDEEYEKHADEIIKNPDFKDVKDKFMMRNMAVDFIMKQLQALKEKYGL